jgi:3',5'-cyclic AMP phosphodiesterase CpdA
MFTFAHISDLHIAPLPAATPWALASKRLLGYLSWHSKRKAQHRAEVLVALRDDLKSAAPDHICVTGDLTNIALPREFAAAAEWLATLGNPDKLSVVPGNHDAYVKVAPRHGLDLWDPWMASDDGAAGFPFVRRRGVVAFVGASSAVPTAPFMATGRLGPAQRTRLRTLLTKLGQEGLYRVVLIHHPPQTGAVHSRHRLSDAGAVRQVLKTAGADLVLHGHAHRPLGATLPGPGGAEIPVLGVGSASSAGLHGRTAGHYHLFRLDIAGGTRRLTVEHRHFDRASGRFIAGHNHDVPGNDGAAVTAAPSAGAGGR